MDRESMARLRLDRRLIRRRAWISAKDLEKELASLPDVSHKAAPQSEGAASEGGRKQDAGPAEPAT
jgi:hypothetical protein